MRSSPVGLWPSSAPVGWVPGLALLLLSAAAASAGPLDTRHVRDSGTTKRLNDVAYGNGVFVAIGGLGSKPMYTSPDGVTWTPRTTAIAGGYLDVIFNGQVFFTLAGKGAFVAVGWDGGIVQSEPVSSPPTGPRLSIRREAGRLVVAWPKAAAGYTLQTRPEASNAEGLGVAALVVEAAGGWAVTLMPTEAREIFRLAK